jgi:thioredoxin reductase (NADPH)
MPTIDEVRAIPLFSTLSDADLERLVRTAADLRLRAGEFAVHEGGERALFAVLSGKVEVVKQFDGIERTLGWRLPGAIKCLWPSRRHFRAAIARRNLRA